MIHHRACFADHFHLGCSLLLVIYTVLIRIDAFELGCWRRLQGEQTYPFFKEINSECSLEGQILRLRLQYFGHLMRREDSLEKTLMLGKCERGEGHGRG